MSQRGCCQIRNAGFVSTTDMTFAFWLIRKKCREQHRDLFTVFVDLLKAFQTVDRDLLWKVLGKFGCPTKFVGAIRAYYQEMNTCVSADDAAFVSHTARELQESLSGVHSTYARAGLKMNLTKTEVLAQCRGGSFDSAAPEYLLMTLNYL